MKADVIIFVLMAVFGDVPQPEVDRACEERELALERTLEGWERDVIKAFLTNEKLKAATPEERLSIPDYKKVIDLFQIRQPAKQAPPLFEKGEQRCWSAPVQPEEEEGLRPTHLASQEGG